MALKKKTENLNESKIPLHNSIKELAIENFKTLCIANIICIVITFSMSAIMNWHWVGKLITVIVNIVIAGSMVYGHNWNFGDKDANYIQFGRMTYDKFKPLRYGMIALAPSLISDIILLVSKLSGSFDLMWLYRLMNAPFWALINLIHPYGALPHAATEETVVMAGTEYEEVIAAAAATPGLGWGQMILIMLLPLIFMLFIWGGYELGRRRISINQKLVYVDKDKNKKKK